MTHPRGTCYVVRDAMQRVRHTGRTKHDALQPYTGRLTKRAVRGGRRLMTADTLGISLRTSNLWTFLYRRGWTCRREVHRNGPPLPDQ